MQGAQTQEPRFSESFRNRVMALFADPIQHQFLHRAIEKGRSGEVRRAILGERGKPLSLDLMHAGLNAEKGSTEHKEALAAVERQRELDALYLLIIRNDHP